ncbi:hypothetical protein CBR_g40196 [Chara braunii]|uniref:Uncharacterized protein n=1 Tax=Chara braunii TaxID=69332 RepID=A0A388LT95_CHABU|nr:hypothetical protein CBR_g40196 [Chara braunii]|eukprot:GBG85558.1 hypothetical protein CBR_g40196 [Chara braunii]
MDVSMWSDVTDVKRCMHNPGESRDQRGGEEGAVRTYSAEGGGVLACGLESPRHIGEGVISGFGGFASKLFDGFTHLVNDPLEGATRDGATGFVKGMASGIVGAIQKPAEGVSVLAKQVGTGLRATPDAIFGTGSGLLEGLPEDGRSELREIEALKPSFLQADANAKPAHVGEGLMFGLKSLGSGVYDGVTGLVTEPLKAAISSTGQSTPQTGVLFAKGFARGIAGVICKPAAGALDLASNAMSGLIATPGAVIAAAKEGPSLTETPTMQRLSNLREGLNQRVQAIAERVSEDGEAARRHDATSS